MRDKLDAQNMSRKGAKGAKKELGKPTTETAAQKKPAAGKKNVESDETLYAIIEELKNDLKQRDTEFEHLQSKVEKMSD